MRNKNYCKTCGQHINKFPPRDIEDIFHYLLNLENAILVLKKTQKKLKPLIIEETLKMGLLDAVCCRYDDPLFEDDLEYRGKCYSCGTLYEQLLQNLCNLTFKEVDP